MKRILLITALVTGVIASGYSQQQKHDRSQRPERTERRQQAPEERAKRYADHLDKQLNLTEKQEKEVYALHLKNINVRDRVQKNRLEQRQKDLKKMRSERDESERRLNKILSPNQRKDERRTERPF